MLTFIDQPVVTKLRKLRVNVGDFELRKVIGRGHFGEVHLVKEKQTGDVYAMKIIKKSDTLAKQSVRHLNFLFKKNVLALTLVFLRFHFMKRRRILWQRQSQSLVDVFTLLLSRPREPIFCNNFGKCAHSKVILY